MNTIMNLISRAKRAKRLNALKVFNYLFLRIQQYSKHHLPLGSPLGAMVELCNICNLKCQLCPVSGLKRKKGYMEEAVFKKIVDELDDRIITSFTPVMWGESLLHPQIIEFLNYARKKKWDIIISTNGNINQTPEFYEKFVKTGIDEIVCAVDGYNQETYSIYRRQGELKKVCDFLQGVKEAKERLRSSTPKIVVQIILFKYTEDHIEDIKALVKPYADSIITKKLRIFKTNPDQDIIEKDNLLRPIEMENQFLSSKERGISNCTSMLDGIYIAYNGDVLACCGDSENVLKFGSVKEKTIREIQQSKAFISRKQMNLRGDFQGLCKECMERR